MRTKVFGFSVMIKNFIVLPKRHFVLRLFELLYTCQYDAMCRMYSTSAL